MQASSAGLTFLHSVRPLSIIPALIKPPNKPITSPTFVAAAAEGRLKIKKPAKIRRML